jgi:hypothetical protein
MRGTLGKGALLVWSALCVYVHMPLAQPHVPQQRVPWAAVFWPSRLAAEVALCAHDRCSLGCSIIRESWQVSTAGRQRMPARFSCLLKGMAWVAKHVTGRACNMGPRCRRQAEPQDVGVSGTLVSRNNSLALVVLRAGGSLSTTAALQGTAPPVYSRRFQQSLVASAGRSSGFISV